MTFKACVSCLLVFYHSVKVIQLFQSMVLGISGCSTKPQCAAALDLAESFVLQSFLDWDKEQSSATCAVTLPKKCTMSISLDDPKFFHHLEAHTFHAFRRNTYD